MSGSGTRNPAASVQPMPCLLPTMTGIGASLRASIDAVKRLGVLGQPCAQRGVVAAVAQSASASSVVDQGWSCGVEYVGEVIDGSVEGRAFDGDTCVDLVGGGLGGADRDPDRLGGAVPASAEHHPCQGQCGGTSKKR